MGAKAVWNGAVIAESDDIVVVDGYTYFPEDEVQGEYLDESSHTSVCGWKGEARYYDVVVDGRVNKAAAWYYATPKKGAEIVQGRVGFWRGVKILDGEDGASVRGARPSLLDRLFSRAKAS